MAPTSPQKKSRIRPLLSLTGVARSEGPMFLKISLIMISLSVLTHLRSHSGVE